MYSTFVVVDVMLECLNLYTDNRYVAGFVNKNYTINEGSGSVEVCVHITSGIAQPVTLLLQTSDVFTKDSALSKCITMIGIRTVIFS